MKNLPEIIAIFQEQNPLARPERIVRGIFFAGHRYLYCVKVEGEIHHGTVAEVRQWKLPSRTHSPKPKSKTDTVHALVGEFDWLDFKRLMPAAIRAPRDVSALSILGTRLERQM